MSSKTNKGNFMFPRMASQVGTCCHSPVENADRKISCQTLGARHLVMGRGAEGARKIMVKRKDRTGENKVVPRPIQTAFFSDTSATLISARKRVGSEKSGTGSPMG